MHGGSGIVKDWLELVAKGNVTNDERKGHWNEWNDPKTTNVMFL